ncbi:hypothetical protein NE857_33895 (plasmid) [Nocardiopsis exhalans]|uniref:Pycsar effector protein domain-containing protein n=1 Tax=Nocardiopsis exhalans TaxID=163604 RepID=A0ABY5DJ51_9ACTN|nr:hypothetical protein [Nocardiopsis exhalans]USY23628.1 hypothetical protein NE857_33895 [Nocardiopsis exhalans]
MNTTPTDTTTDTTDTAEQDQQDDQAPAPAQPHTEEAPAVTAPAPRRHVEAVPATLAEAAAADATTDLARTDTSNAALAGLSGVLLTILVAGAGLTSADGGFPVVAQAAMGAAAAVLAGVLVILAAAMWPRHGGVGGVPHYARLTGTELADELAQAAADPAAEARWHAERATAKARIAVRKHAHQRAAAAGLALAGVLLAVATIVTITLT